MGFRVEVWGYSRPPSPLGTLGKVPKNSDRRHWHAASRRDAIDWVQGFRASGVSVVQGFMRITLADCSCAPKKVNIAPVYLSGESEIEAGKRFKARHSMHYMTGMTVHVSTVWAENVVKSNP